MILPPEFWPTMERAACDQEAKKKSPAGCPEHICAICGYPAGDIFFYEVSDFADTILVLRLKVLKCG